MQDNDPKHTSRLASQFFEDNGINWWRTPAESPDCNPIENLWHDIKGFLRREVKPETKQQLIDGIQLFWTTVDVPECTKYIRHLRKVIPRVIEQQQLDANESTKVQNPRRYLVAHAQKIYVRV